MAFPEVDIRIPEGEVGIHILEEEALADLLELLVVLEVAFRIPVVVDIRIPEGEVGIHILEGEFAHLVEVVAVEALVVLRLVLVGDSLLVLLLVEVAFRPVVGFVET